MEAQRFTFTKRALEAVTPTKGIAMVYDDKVPKLGCRVFASGIRTFYVVTRVPGGRFEWIKLGRLGDLTVEQARVQASRYLGQFAEGLNPAQIKREAKGELTAGEAFAAYLKDRELRGVKRVADLRQTWQRCIGEIPEDAKKRPRGRQRSKHPGGVNWENAKLSSITHEKVRALHAAIGKTHPVLANRVAELLSALFNHMALPNPTKGIAPFKERSRERFLREAELPRFFAALAEDTNESFRHFVLLALLTGARSGNVRAMRFADIDLDRGVWLIPGEFSKSGSPMDIPIVSEALDIIKSRREADPEGIYVFAAKSASGHMDKPKKRWTALLERAKLHDLRLHDLRRSLGSWQAILGASLPIIGRSLGHKDASSTAIYARLHLDPVRASMEAATSAMLAKGGLKGAAVVPMPRKRGKAVTK